MDEVKGKLITKYPMSEIQENELMKWFTSNISSADQTDRFETLRYFAKTLAVQITTLCPPCADRTAAIRKLRECLFTANAAIVCNETILDSGL